MNSKLVQGMYASLLPVSTGIGLVQGMTALWALVYRGPRQALSSTTAT